jgi:protein-tyrosine phosphatase/membrane-associated phospholipid phosphatase
MVRAASTSVLLSALFIVVYGSINWFTAHRSNDAVRTWYFAWEPTVIPYVPLLIVPYMSMDLFFFMAPFLCQNKQEIRILARRVGFSILTAAAFFLLLPLRLAWPARPAVGGWFGDFVEKSCTAPFLMEYPHNLFPALHIVLCLIVADVYGRHARGIVRILSYTWFSLIGISTVLTWQHHLVDVAGGFVLAGFAFYFFREGTVRLPVVANFRIGCWYAVGAVAVLILAQAIWPWGAFLLWPAAALATVGAAYFGLGPGIFRKADGRLPLSSHFVLAPVLIGQYLSRAYYRRRCRAWDQVAQGVLIGRTLTKAEAADAVSQGVTAVLDLTAEFTEAAPFREIRYRNIPILDLTAPTLDQLREAVAFITDETANGLVYVHCKIGYSRSAAVVGAYLLASHEAATLEEVLVRLHEARPSIIIRSEAMEALRIFAQSGPCTTQRPMVGTRGSHHLDPVPEMP